MEQSAGVKESSEISTTDFKAPESCIHGGEPGSQTRGDLYQRGGCRSISVASVYPGQERPDELTPAKGSLDTSSSSTDGTSYAVRSTDFDWGNSITLTGGGGGGTYSHLINLETPDYYVADLYINNELAAQMELHLQEEE